ncbi:MAG: thioredoxin fold domain-containing protein [Methanosarcinaceae archaeon]|nr:thioredoxin fold domain-containing protein [Methanosarcinaceae archaeon]
MTKSSTTFLLIFGIPLLFLAVIASAQSAGWIASEQSQSGDIVESTTLPDGEMLRLGKLNFYTSLDRGIEKANESEKMVFVYFRSESCGWCKKFEAESFNDIRIIKILNENFELVTLDTVKQQELAISMRVRGTPTEVFLKPDGTEIKDARIPGYVDTDTFLKLLNEIIDKK